VEKFIDIERVISDKNPKLVKWIPRFLLKYLKKTLHEKDVNTFIQENKGKNSFEFCKEVIRDFNIKLEIEGLENIPKTGGTVLTCNHPLGGMDAMALVTVIEPIRKDLKFIVNDILLNLENLKDMFVGVNKVGKNAKDSLQKVDELFATEQLICVFPAGLVSRKIKGKVTDLEWKKTFVTRSKNRDKQIVPVYLDGELSSFFYTISKIRSGLKIKANIEMFYLVNELYKQQNKQMKIVFGKPISSSSFTSDKSDFQWAQEIKNKVYQLANQK
jgi:putative hemolysin